MQMCGWVGLQPWSALDQAGLTLRDKGDFTRLPVFSRETGELRISKTNFQSSSHLSDG